MGRATATLQSVQYLEKTASGSLRIVSFKGFDFDKIPELINK
ncbi:hypothetical protein [Lysinibacillus sp. FSL K6-4013]